MQGFINSSALTKLLANTFIFAVMIAALVIAVYNVLNNQPINANASLLIEGGLVYAASMLGFHVGGVQALQAQNQMQAIPPTATVPVSVQVQQAPVAPAPLQQEPGGLPAGNAG